MVIGWITLLFLYFSAKIVIFFVPARGIIGK